MVNFLHKYFYQDRFLVKLSEVSDNIYEDNDNSYIDFDKFKEPVNCCDITKDMKNLEDIKEWFKN